jgi:HAD superfamily hydrolase (TIGR01509 family)
MSAAALPLDPNQVRVLLLDADGNLFPSEEHAFVPSTAIVNRFLANRGLDDRYEPEELRRATSGMNFRTTITRLASERDIELSGTELERMVDLERENVTRYLSEVLRPDESVRDVLRDLGRAVDLVAVSSSASPRLAACFQATALDELIPAAARFSAEDSLPTPRSKPDPAIYLHALAACGIDAHQGIAVEDAAPGVQSAVGAGIPTVGNLTFVPGDERAEREADLLEAGASTVVASWGELADLLSPALAVPR